MPSLQNGIYRIKSRASQSQSGNQLFVGVDNSQRRGQRSGHIKEGTPIVLVRKEKITKVEVKNAGGDNYRMMFISQEASGMNLGCEKDNLQKNNKVFVTKQDVEWAIDQGSQQNCYQ
ncbi:hypothetical protein BN14_03732 [Rhizoctonia solani AG-1 IB]|uniref:Uncharacterized protein n=1 Tax=Thanatephorus cucumeris (strain AG1-IB / isolate 7/3/14) TaxID=1108050 RepID=M5BR71_THACB|nr:hypothetical protein BN14_03732 [Rhizoctonia solani AG-1 IB]